jgi:hypothetical protein
MPKKIISYLVVFILLFAACSKDKESSNEFGSPSSDGSHKVGGGKTGMTAGEWNDLDSWSFWQNLMKEASYKKFVIQWGFNTQYRISILAFGPDSLPMVDFKVELLQKASVFSIGKTDNHGRLDFFIHPSKLSGPPNLQDFSLKIPLLNYTHSNLIFFDSGVNVLHLAAVSAKPETIDLAFVVDATGSMGDEMEYVKTELYDVINRVKIKNPLAIVRTGAVFYKDEGDEYVSKFSQFSTDNSNTVNYIKSQSAGGGGDWPEAVHTALNSAIKDLNWTDNAKTRLLFLVLDAPPHFNEKVLASLATTLEKAKEKGIKIIPIAASGVDQETEFLLRAFSIASNGTYVFVTNDSGIGNDHLKPTVGYFEVEFLKDLMVRLINEYAE